MVKLLENLSEFPEKPLYACLSYCWGGDQKVKLQGSTHAPFTQGVALSDLPLNFRHIIPFVQQLGLDYLWIDALCIRQDSSEEMAVEIANMGLIYKGATLTVALAHPTTVDAGVFGDVEPHMRSIPINIPDDQSPYQGHCIRGPTGQDHLTNVDGQLMSEEGASSYPLLHRGW